MSLLLFMASLFIGFLVKKYVACQSRKSDFGWHHFRFFSCLMRKRIESFVKESFDFERFSCLEFIFEKSTGKPA